MCKYDVLTIGNKKIRSWAKNLDSVSKTQLKAMVNNNFIMNPIYLMADAHAGYGVPIGTVVKTQDVVMPNAVGVDIGCGMTCTLFTTHQEIDLQALYEEIKTNRNSLVLDLESEIEPILDVYEENLSYSLSPNYDLVDDILEKIKTQFGTLGGGNHFIEVGKVMNEPHQYYLLVHSGSRGAGAMVARHFNEVAKELNTAWQSHFTPDLHFIHCSSEEFENYFICLDIMDKFAKTNRTAISNFVLNQMRDKKAKPVQKERIPSIDCTHNSASKASSTDGHIYVVHHKGANSFKRSKYAVIAGTQGTPSYLCEAGPQATESLLSCSHGAGRVYSRTKAKKELCLDTALKQMEGIVHGIANRADLDEAPNAYKDIEEVINQQKGIVIPRYKLQPLMVFKE